MSTVLVISTTAAAALALAIGSATWWTKRLLRASDDEVRKWRSRLINAQEDERRRIARELHDDLHQRLALVSIELDQAGRLGKIPALSHVRELVHGLAIDVHQLAYRLHPAKLDQLGMVIAARSWCRDLSTRTGLRIEFTATDVPRELSPDAALGLYRILQESLQNVVRHSGSRDAFVCLRGEGPSLRLVVTDRGVGCDASSIEGLGLVGMRERARMLNGTLDVRSSPGAGTTVEAVVLLPPPASPSAPLALRHGDAQQPGGSVGITDAQPPDWGRNMMSAWLRNQSFPH